MVITNKILKISVAGLTFIAGSCSNDKNINCAKEYLRVYEKEKKEVDLTKPLDYTPTRVVVGDVATGKTSLFNGICGTNFSVGGNGESTTRLLYCLPSVWEDAAFDFIDTPSMGSGQHQVEHAFHIFKGITTRSVNTIFIILDGSTGNIETLYQQYVKLASPIYNGIVSLYEEEVLKVEKRESQSSVENNKQEPINKQIRSSTLDKIILIFNKMDAIDEDDREEKVDNILKKFKMSDVDVDCIFYGLPRSPKTRPEECRVQFSLIAKEMRRLMLKRKPAKLDIQMKDFMAYYKCFSPDSEKHELFEKFEERAIEREKQIKEEIVKLLKEDSSRHNENFYGAAMISFRNALENLSKEHLSIKKIPYTLSVIEDYLFRMQVSAYCIERKDALLKDLSGSIKMVFFDKANIKNLIKRCVNCGAIWVKVAGCPNTVCGERPSYLTDRLSSFGKDENNLLNTFQDYEFIYDENKQEYKLKSQNIKSKNEEAKMSKFEREGLQIRYYYNEEIPRKIEKDTRTGKEKIIPRIIIKHYLDLPLSIEVHKENFKEDGNDVFYIIKEGKKQRVYKSQPRGCLNPIKWDEPIGFLSDDEIMKFFNVETMDKAKEFFNLSHIVDPSTAANEEESGFET